MGGFVRRTMWAWTQRTPPRSPVDLGRACFFSRLLLPPSCKPSSLKPSPAPSHLINSSNHQVASLPSAIITSSIPQTHPGLQQELSTPNPSHQSAPMPHPSHQPHQHTPSSTLSNSPATFFSSNPPVTPTTIYFIP